MRPASLPAQQWGEPRAARESPERHERAAPPRLVAHSWLRRLSSIADKRKVDVGLADEKRKIQCVATSFCVIDTAAVQWLLSILADERTCNDSILVAAILLVVYSAKSSNFICHMRNLLEEKTSGSPPCPCPGEDGGRQRSRKRSRSRSRLRRDLSVSTFETDD
ncbi:uncharacterized protein LOC126263268 [Schistocerca nitens]|uniref:uncharacterized protein LOC126263268 n=1 Tax=Schistocerca nitens TaxID=7011 RepID=UPI002119A17C|nr:uncharacterized protein LOC126263268 [Schistocerca nitens]